jgi:AcrR family transcriptional regulator
MEIETCSNSAMTAQPAPETGAGALARSQAARRRRVLDAALRLAADGGFDAVQMRDVAAAADVALGTVYRYFSSKEHLYAAAMLEWASVMTPNLLPVGAEPENDEQRLRRFLRRVVKSFERWPRMMRAEMVIETSSDPNARALLEGFSQNFVASVRAVLRDMSPANAEAVARLINSVTYRELRAWALGRQSIDDVERHSMKAVDLIFSGPPT